MARAWATGAALIAMGCSPDYGLENKPTGGDGMAPDILVEPNALTFGELRADEEEVQSFTVTNVGFSTLHVSDVVVGAGLAFEVRGPEVTFELEPEAFTTVEVAFTPMGADENFGQVLVLSDDLDTPEAPVDLLGYGSVPELEITPGSYIFTDTVVPCGSGVELTLTNIGSEDLVVTDLAYESGGLLSLDDTDLRPQLPVTLAPGQHRAVWVNFAPTEEGADTGRLDVFSNDPRGVVSADQNGEGQFGDTNVEQFTEPGIPPVDVLMLIDHSCSMEDANTNDVESGMPDFVNVLQTVADWQLIQVTKESGCANGGVLDPSTPNAADLLIDHAWDKDPGEWQYLTEALLELAAVALDQTDPGECNAGFLRTGALLHVITISDEAEQSGQAFTHWLGEYDNHVLAQDFVKVSAVVDLNVTCGDGSGPDGYIDAAYATGGSVLNICNADWGSSFGDVASDVLDGIRTYNLSSPAVDGTIVVTVNGVATTAFTYSSAGNSVTIEDPPIGDGDLVEITYIVAGEC
ncbi:MAG: choice-of-anchor D domain-containing protein [Myxococcota bacterium]